MKLSVYLLTLFAINFAHAQYVPGRGTPYKYPKANQSYSTPYPPVSQGRGQYYNESPGFLNLYKVQMGFRLAPALTTNYVDGINKYSGFLDDGFSLQLSTGPFADLFFSEKYAFSTGLYYTVKHIGLRVPGGFADEVARANSPAGTSTSTVVDRTSGYNLQYLQVPLTFKLFSSEIRNQGRLYIQFGGIGEIKIAEKPLERSRNAVYLFNKSAGRIPTFNFGDASLILAIGGEVPLGNNDYAFLGFFYNRGLTEVAKDKDLIIKNSLFGIEMGLKF
jgi:hypothetical protein